MEEAILVINAGSSSIKFAAYVVRSDEQDLNPIYRGEVSRIGRCAHLMVEGPNGTSRENQAIAATSHEEALSYLLTWIERQKAEYAFVAAGHRVVHGGTAFQQPKIITPAMIVRLQKLTPLAPLHQPHNLAAITSLNRLRPNLVQVACFDTAFHHTMPIEEQTFALPTELTEEGIRRYGFHGLSYEYVTSVLPRHLGSAAAGRVIVAHLGHGASLCAMRDGKSIATTMTFTPLDGLPMATRCGSIDPAVILYLMREKGMDARAVSDLLHHRSGLLGVSGISGDMRALLASNKPEALQAIDLFVHRVNRELGSLAAALGGLDAVVFTAGIGERAPLIRTRICEQAGWLGIRLDDCANTANRTRISASDSPISAWVIPTNEELVIARHTWALAGIPEEK